ncbi:MAG TPA: YifB family Mg chelatase-like AAA ATPase [Deinococcales bacterium]|nr:YifB family Mg chelatase-like AAA ATPase [Deinococcales bacterium]
MLSHAYSAALVGVEGQIVEIEVDARPSVFGITLVGLPDAAVQESKERVRAAVRNSDLEWPKGHVTVNLAPADLRKEGSVFDLPMAVAIVAGPERLEPEALRSTLMAGELALDGSLRPVPGAINLALAAAQNGFRRVLVPPENAAEAAIVDSLEVFAPQNLREAVGFLKGRVTLERARPGDLSEEEPTPLDLMDVKGQAAGKRALEIAVAGAHNLLFIGPPGSGKTMLARRAVGLRPPLSREEALEVTRIHSAAGRLPRGLMRLPPFRSPHHTVSDAGLIGGGSVPKPGEVSLAHRGILFLDELPEFSRRALEVLRQPLEEGEVTISRARTSVTYPAAFQLLAAMNPSPSGDWGDPNDPARRRYLSRLSGPLLDRIDLVVSVNKLTPSELLSAAPGEPTAGIRSRVLAARERMLARQGCANASLVGKALRQHAALHGGAERFMHAASRQLDLTGRGFDRVLRVARTVADLAGHEGIDEGHLAEAVSFRQRDW